MITPPPLPEPKKAKLARTGLVLSLAAIGFCIFIALSGNGLRKSSEPLSGVRPSGMTNLMARYAIGLREMMKPSGMWQPQMANELSASIKQEAKRPVDHFRAAIVNAALLDQPIPLDALKELVKTAPELAEDLATLTDLEAKNGASDDKIYSKLQARHGWVAKLAKSHAADWKDEAWPTIRNEAILTSTVLGGMGVGAFGLFALGVILLVKRLRDYRLTGLVPRMPQVEFSFACTMVEAFAIYLFAYSVLLGLLHKQLPTWPTVAFYGVALAFVVLGIFWPRWRGMDHHTWRQAMGLHRGEGWWREISAGILGWVTGMPLLVVGAALAPIISKWTGMDPTHPIVDEIVAPGASKWGIVALAVIWAPLTEEAMFRGLLFPGLSAMLRPIVGALLSAFIFAVIHPQGWAGVPAIMVIALTMSVLRMKRGSLIAPMTAHALNNGLVSVLIVFAT